MVDTARERTVKKIIFFGRKEDEEAFSKRFQGHQELQLRTISNVRKLPKAVKTFKPDFVILAGRIQLNQDGTYTILI